MNSSIFADCDIWDFRIKNKKRLNIKIILIYIFKLHRDRFHQFRNYTFLECELDKNVFKKTLYSKYSQISSTISTLFKSIQKVSFIDKTTFIEIRVLSKFEFYR